MKKEKDNILEAYEEMLNEARGYYVGLWNRQFYAKEYKQINVPPNIGSEKLRDIVITQHIDFFDDMVKLELMVLKYLQQMDKRSEKWEKWLKSQGL